MSKNTRSGVINVLSIDIDYAYSPSINSYDDHIIGSRLSLQEQNEINEKLNLPAPRINPLKLVYLKDVLKKKLSNKAPTFFITHHHEILKYLPEEKFNLYNFDHHHDIFYPGWHKVEELDEGNWVHHVNQSHLKEYCWIRNNDSEWIQSLDGLTANVVVMSPEPSLQLLPLFDLVIICISPHWTGITNISDAQAMFNID